MKIDVVGSMCTWTKKLSTSFIINDEIIFDVPQGTFKTLFVDYDILKTKIIIISHFHSDHFMDLHLVLDYIYHHTDNRITLIAPKGCKERLSQLFKIIEIPYLEDMIVNRVDFIDCENNKIVKTNGYKIKIFKMQHINLDSYGFTIEKDGVNIGFSGDSAMCNNIRKIVAKSNAAFIDCAQTKINNKHLSAQEIKGLTDEFPDCKIYPVHLSIFSIEELKKLKIPFPEQGQIIEVK